MDNLMKVPEQSLHQIYQFWLNLEAETKQTMYRYNLTDSSMKVERMNEIREGMEPVRNEIARRARLVLK